MLVRDWMSGKVIHVKPRDSVMHAREVLEEHRIRQLPVAVAGKLVGIITDRDLRDAFPSVFDERFHGQRAPKDWTDPDALQVETVMSPAVLTVAPRDTLHGAAQRMIDERIGAVPVVDEDGILCGILTRSDVLKAFVSLCDTFASMRKKE